MAVLMSPNCAVCVQEGARWCSRSLTIRSILGQRTPLTLVSPSSTPPGKWARGGWAASDEDEKRVKEETQVGASVDAISGL